MAFLLAVYFFLYRTASFFDPGTHPSEEEMIEDFYKNKDEFEKMAQKGLEDYKSGLKRIYATDAYYGNDEESNVDVREYYSFIKKMDLDAGISFGEDRVYFLASTVGFVYTEGNSTKGYLYSEEDVFNKFEEEGDFTEESVESIDDNLELSRQAYTIYQEIEDNWYLYYDFEGYDSEKED